MESYEERERKRQEQYEQVQREADHKKDIEDTRGKAFATCCVAAGLIFGIYRACWENESLPDSSWILRFGDAVYTIIFFALAMIVVTMLGTLFIKWTQDSFDGKAPIAWLIVLLVAAAIITL